MLAGRLVFFSRGQFWADIGGSILPLATIAITRFVQRLLSSAAISSGAVPIIYTLLRVAPPTFLQMHIRFFFAIISASSASLDGGRKSAPYTGAIEQSVRR